MIYTSPSAGNAFGDHRQCPDQSNGGPMYSLLDYVYAMMKLLSRPLSRSDGALEKLGRHQTLEAIYGGHSSGADVVAAASMMDSDRARFRRETLLRKGDSPDCANWARFYDDLDDLR